MGFFEPAEVFNCFDDEWIWKMEENDAPLDKKKL